ncbi:zinc ABC transporter substrate-binding protein [Psychromarinibacter sp. C21-152]|uniref:High-affinity zinc uptake system protein ZnuA n=1 Tax=Psychromarinibacter sediminicola TaxID=3033385 RepID=A0AAE3NUE4_9RHOB|nr:zinc ABC transporter substrate-binding protein [Psychromarinibacter sediminicola]MDF0603718.1 zinc ABC transporter substrate-binding protein [Psychromarinibacter sediminicola]
MSNQIRIALLGGLLGASVATAAPAEAPKVAADIEPVHGLVARVMDGIGTPSLVVRPGASPHGYSMRPSEARALQEAEAVFWVGPELAPWLEGSIDTLASGAVVVELLDAPGTQTLAFREGASFGADGHDHDEAEHEEDGHDDGHDHDGLDPHAWLDPENAKAWLDVIAAELARLDPENAGAYAANAEAGKAEIDAAMEDVRAMLAPVRDMRFVVFHDAYQYFEHRFDIPAAGAIALSDATDPGPARVAEIRDTIVAMDVRCVFSEPQFNQDLVDTVLEGTGGAAGTIDPLGSGIPGGAGFYPAFLRSIAAEMAACGS